MIKLDASYYTIVTIKLPWYKRKKVTIKHKSDASFYDTLYIKSDLRLTHADLKQSHFDKIFNRHRNDLGLGSVGVLGVFSVHRPRKGSPDPTFPRAITIDWLVLQKRPARVSSRRTWSARSTRDTVIEFSQPVITRAIDTNLYMRDLCSPSADCAFCATRCILQDTHESLLLFVRRGTCLERRL